MSVSAIDTLMQLATPARPVEPPARSVNEPNSFAPSLEKAYEADKPRERPATVEEQESRATAVGQASDSEGRDHENASETDDISEAAAVIEESDQADDEAATDEVEISE